MGYPLGEPPLCEPSAAVPSPFAPGELLVADNEIDDALFVFARSPAGLLTGQRRLPMPPGLRPDDIEALAVHRGDLFVVGSHSRNKRCEPRPHRARIRQLRAVGGALEEVASLDSSTLQESLSSTDACLTVLFTSPAPAHAREVCDALVRAERTADPGRCEVLNIEGAVSVGDRLWLGLRSPTVGSSAVALRLVWPASRLRFDAVSLINLDGDGIRELSAGGGEVIGLAGPPLDSDRHFQIWWVSTSAFDADPTPVGRRPAPTSSEGLAVGEDRLVVVIDGAEGASARTCKVAARQDLIER